MQVHLTLYSSRIAHTLAILTFTSAQKHRSQNCLPLPVCKLPSSPWLRTDMMLSQKPAFASAVRGLRSGLPACLPAAAGTQRRVVVRFRDEQKSDIERLEQQLTNDAQTPTDAANKFSSEQVEQLKGKNPHQTDAAAGGQNMWLYQSGDVSPRNAEMRADLGKSADPWNAQVFDGPAPETINGCLAMIGVLTGLLGEWTSGLGLLQQTANQPLIVFGSFLLISFASYAPIARGYTRKEPYANHLLGFNWSPRAENWNGRVAMLGFAGMVLTEWIAGVNTLQAWGLQSTNFPGL